MEKKSGAVRDSVTQTQTQHIDNASSAMRDSADAMVEPGSSSLINKDGTISQNPNSQGFAFEHKQVETFNANAAMKGEPLEAIRIPPGGVDQVNEEYGLDLDFDRLGEPDIIIINKETGEVLQTIQAKSGNETTINNAIKDGKYEDTDNFVVNDENQHIANQHDNVSTIIEQDGVTSDPISIDEAIDIAVDPESASDAIGLDADIQEVGGGAVGGAVIGGGVALAHSSIKTLAKVYKGEPVDKTVLFNALKDVFEGIKTGALRGIVIKILKKLIDAENNPSLPVAIVAIGMEVFPVMLQYFKDEITFEEMVKTCGVKALSTGVIVVLCMTYPPIGIALLGFSVMKAIWQEFRLRELLGKNTRVDRCLSSMESGTSFVKKKTQQAATATKETATNAAIATKETATNAAIVTKETAANAAIATKETAANAAIATKETAANAAVATKETATNAAIATKETAANVAEATKDVSINAAQATKDAAKATKDKAGELFSGVKAGASSFGLKFSKKPFSK